MKKEKDLSQKVMEEIEKRGVKMKPRFYFVLGSLLLGMGLAGFVFLTSFFVHLILFRLKVPGVLPFLHFGSKGWRPFLMNFPWLPLFLAMAGLAGGALLLKRYDFSYRKNFGGLLLVLVGLVVAFGLIFNRMEPEKRLMELGPVRPLYQPRFQGHDWVVGEIVEVEEGKIILQTPDGQEMTVVWDEKTRLPLGMDFEKGDQLRVIGEWENGMIKAEGILKEKPFPADRPFRDGKTAPGKAKGGFYR